MICTVVVKFDAVSTWGSHFLTASPGLRVGDVVFEIGDIILTDELEPHTCVHLLIKECRAHEPSLPRVVVARAGERLILVPAKIGESPINRSNAVVSVQEAAALEANRAEVEAIAISAIFSEIDSRAADARAAADSKEERERKLHEVERKVQLARAGSAATDAKTAASSIADKGFSAILRASESDQLENDGGLKIGIGCSLSIVSGRIQITAVKPDGGAAASGVVRAGDVLVSLNGIRVTSEAQAKELILGPFGTSLEAELARDGKAFFATIWRGGADVKAKGEAVAKVAAEAKAVADAVRQKAPSNTNISDFVGLGLVVDRVTSGFKVTNVRTFCLLQRCC